MLRRGDIDASRFAALHFNEGRVHVICAALAIPCKLRAARAVHELQQRGSAKEGGHAGERAY